MNNAIKKITVLCSNKHFLILFVFLIGFIPRAICALMMYPVNTQVDEVSTLSIAAYVAGYDWSEVISAARHYYGFGYAIIFAPVFKIISNPVVIYRVVLVTAAFIFALIAPICYHILDRYLIVKNRTYKVIVSIICSYFTCGNLGPCAINETQLYLIIWLLSLNIFKLVEAEDRKERVLYTITMSVLLIYSITVHERAIVLLIVASIWIAFSYIRYRKIYVNLPVFFLSVIIMYIVARMCTSHVQGLLWNGTEGVANTGINLNSSYFEMITNPLAWKAAYLIIVGLFNTIIIYSGGVIVISVVMIISLLFCKKRYKEDISIIKVNSITVTFGLAAILGVMGIAVLWNGGVQTAINAGYGSNIYSLRAVTYMRYYGCFLSPCLLCGLYLMYKYRDKIGKYFRLSLIIIGVLQMIWFHTVLPYIYNSHDAHYRFMPYAFADYSVKDVKWLYICGSIWLLGILIVTYCTYRKKPILTLLPICLFLIYQNVELYGAMVKVGPEYYARTDAGYAEVVRIREEGYSIDNICALSNAEMYQFMLNREQIHVTLPDGIEDNNIILADYYSQELIDGGYKFRMLDENEYLYYSGDIP